MSEFPPLKVYHHGHDINREALSNAILEVIKRKVDRDSLKMGTPISISACAMSE